MPHVEIKCYPGRTEEQKNECAKAITQAIADTMGCSTTSVSVAIKEVEPSDWKEQVWNAQIIPDEGFLYKKPEYTCE